MPKLGFAKGVYYILIDGQTWTLTRDPRMALEFRRAINVLKFKRGFYVASRTN